MPILVQVSIFRVHSHCAPPHLGYWGRSPAVNRDLSTAQESGVSAFFRRGARFGLAACFSSATSWRSDLISLASRSFSIRASDAIAFTASNESRSTRSMSAMIRSSWVRTGSRLPHARPGGAGGGSHYTGKIVEQGIAGLAWYPRLRFIPSYGIHGARRNAANCPSGRWSVPRKSIRQARTQIDEDRADSLDTAQAVRRPVQLSRCWNTDADGGQLWQARRVRRRREGQASISAIRPLWCLDRSAECTPKGCRAARCSIWRLCSGFPDSGSPESRNRSG